MQTEVGRLTGKMEYIEKLLGFHWDLRINYSKENGMIHADLSVEKATQMWPTGTLGREPYHNHSRGNRTGGEHMKAQELCMLQLHCLSAQ